MFYQSAQQSHEEEDQGLIEYALLITLVALAVATILVVLSDTVEKQFCTIGMSF